MHRKRTDAAAVVAANAVFVCGGDEAESKDVLRFSAESAAKKKRN